MSYSKNGTTNRGVGFRDIRARAAHHHSEYVSRTFQKEILNSVEQAQVFEDIGWPWEFSDTNVSSKIHFPCEVTPLTSEDAVWRANAFCLGSSRICVLNFASFKHPGGGYLQGANSQEESLCHVSTLYEVLSQFPEYYQKNTTCLNYGIYQNRSLYTPQIQFTAAEGGFGVHGVYFPADVLTCAAPNSKVVMRYHPEKYEEVRKAMLSRIVHIVKAIMSLQLSLPRHIDHVILGAFGCGVFGNNISYVARCFCRVLQIAYQCMLQLNQEEKFPFIEFAVPKIRNDDTTYDIFNKEVNRLRILDENDISHIDIREVDDIYESFI